jgi:heat shock protein HtpX
LSNNVKTVVLLVALSSILIFIGYLIAGPMGAAIALIFSFIMNIGSYWFSDKLALKMTGAREISPDDGEDAARLHRIVDEVASISNMPKPRVYIIQNDAPNAFATGRNAKHAAVAATSGIMRILDDRELRAVFGHEIGHIKNKDILVNAVVATVASAITFLATMLQWSLIFGGGRSREGGILGILALLATIILAPIAAGMIRMAVSREREYGADKTGAEITHTPLALASALQKLQSYSQARPMQVNPAVSHLFIVNPLGKVNMAQLFSTHPPTEKRVEKLNEIARRTGNYS